MDDFKFAQVFFDTPYSKRYNRLKEFCRRTLKTQKLTKEEKKDIANILKDLKGVLPSGKG